jgi:exonuclease V gamma subunit
LFSQLLTIRAAGQDRPLPLFPRAGFAYAERLARQPEDRERARQAAETAWLRGERDDLYITQLFREVELFPRPTSELDFESLSRMIFGPLIELSSEERA